MAVQDPKDANASSAERERAVRAILLGLALGLALRLLSRRGR